MPPRPSTQPPNPDPGHPRLHGLDDLVAVVAGGLVGSAARAGIGFFLPTPIGAFPTGILIINLTGSFLLGLYLVRREQAVMARWSVPFWAFGVLGSFTTFSAFSLDVTRLLADGHALIAAGYIGASTVGGLTAAGLGQRIGLVVR